jgi:2-methylisocitrate lyase-like PEP mutase family enzyme
MTDRYDIFAALHVPGDPLVLFNAWDPGSAAVIARAGAKAIATGSWSVAAALGFADGEQLPLDVALAQAGRIVGSVDLPVTIDFESGYAADPRLLEEHSRRLAATGAVGCNFEDGIVDGSGVHDIDVQAKRLAAVRAGVGDRFFLNARTDLFLQASPGDHTESLVRQAMERAHVYAAAGASGFFVPGLIDLHLLASICRESPLPVNAMTWSGAPSDQQFAQSGVARISHGPGPWRLAMKALEDAARTVYASSD